VRRADSAAEGLSALTAVQMLDPRLYWCSGLTALLGSTEGGLSALTPLQTLDLTGCSKLQELPLWLADLTTLKVLDLEDCPACTSRRRTWWARVWRWYSSSCATLARVRAVPPDGKAQTLNLEGCRKGLPEGL
jgi:hypothetical protein